MTLEIHQLMDQVEGAADTMAAQRREHDLLAGEARTWAATGAVRTPRTDRSAPPMTHRLMPD
jgi:hypothetical protein